MYSDNLFIFTCRQASVLAVLATVVAVVVIVGKMLYDKDELLEVNPVYPAPLLFPSSHLSFHLPFFFSLC